MCKIINRYWARKGVYTLPPNIIFGNAKDVIYQKRSLGEDIKEFYEKLNLDGKRFGGYYFLMRPTLVLSDVDLIKKILTSNFNHFTDHPAYANEDKDPLSANLFTLKGEKWRKLRSHLNPAFSAGQCKVMVDILLSCCKDVEILLDTKVAHNEKIDLLQILCKLNGTMLGACAVGLEGSALKNLSSGLHDYSNTFLHNQGLRGSVVNVASLVFPDLLHILKLRLHSDQMTNFFMTTVQNAIKYREDNNIVRKDIMHLLLRLRNTGEINENNTETTHEKLNNKQIAAQCFLFLIAGYEATSITSTFCIYELSLNQVEQDKVREEIDVVLQNTDGKITYDVLSKMKYLDQCIYETLRKYPPMPIHSRVCTQMYKIPDTDVTITKGTPVFVPIYAIHMDPEYFPNPQAFDPDRFSKENKFSRPTSSFMPFGEGPRSCIAYKFGLVQVKLVLVTLLTRYKFSLHHSTKVPIDFDSKDFVIYPSSPILVTAERI
ncbi:hypothetical protein RI129_006043 [Pyrocoelia pectoralis]|uniref:Cytochrome P450 n=1 Tax=Pyrocoelia pectoralis TaxID=417401 RepID=A0AAN7VDE6_9COLE